MKMARNGLVDVGGSVLAYSQPTELWTGPKDHSTNSHLTSNNQDVINLQYMDLEEFLLENVVPPNQHHSSQNTIEGKIFISESQNITSDHGMTMTNSHASSMDSMNSKQYQVNLEHRLDFPPVCSSLTIPTTHDGGMIQSSQSMNGSNTHLMHTSNHGDGLLMPASPDNHNHDMVASLRPLTRAISVSHTSQSSHLTNTSPMRRYSGDAMVPTPAPSSPTNSLHGTPSPHSMGGISPVQSTSGDVQESGRPKRAVKRSRKESVPDENKDDKYWRRRAKNNEAAKRSRDLRREKESQIMQRVTYLERENQVLMNELKSVRMENEDMRKRLSHYEQL